MFQRPNLPHNFERFEAKSAQPFALGRERLFLYQTLLLARVRRQRFFQVRHARSHSRWGYAAQGFEPINRQKPGWSFGCE